MTDVVVSKKKGGQKDKKKGAPSNAGSRKGKFDMFFSRVKQKKVRRALRANGTKVAKALAKKVGQEALIQSLEKSGLVGRLETGRERRARIRQARSEAKLEAARARHEAERAAEAVAKLEAEKKAKRSAAAKKAAATRAANKAKLVAETTTGGHPMI